MKGIRGLILAIGLGIGGALLNYAYLDNKASEVKTEPYIGLGKDIERGDVLTKQHIVKVDVPKINAVRLKDFAFPYDSLAAVEGMPVHRSIPKGSLLLRDDLKAPPPELSFGQGLDSAGDERAMGIPVDARTFVFAHVQPGDMVSFVASSHRLGRPTPAKPPAEKPDAAADGSKPDPSKPPAEPNPTEIIGPFKILSIGNRLGSVDVMRANKIPQTQENVIIISVKVVDGQLEPKAQKLWSMLQATNFQQVGFLLHPRTTK